MKVLYTGVYRDATGWGQAAIDYIMALDTAGVDVVCRPIKLNTNQPQLPERILELEAKSSHGCDHVIQHILPHMMEFSGHFKKSIGLFASETSNFRATSWPDRLNAMTDAWVINRQMYFAANESFVKVPITVIPHATNVERFQRNYAPFEQLNDHADTFKFYFIGEFNRRKNLAALIKAFHAEFHPDEPVNLVIKTSVPGKSPEQAREIVHRFCDDIKPGLKMYNGDVKNFKREIIITDRLTDEGVCRLHKSCDCFVMPSYGEAWCIPAFDAMAFGKTPIVTAWSGFLDYVSEKNGWLVPCQIDQAFGVQDSFMDLYTGNETWGAVSVPALAGRMRKAFQEEGLRNRKAINGITRAHDFSYETIGLKMKKALEHDEAVALAGAAA